MLQQQLVNGFVLGATYALFALGFTMMFGVLGVINLTYGVYFALGAFAALWASKSLGLSVWLALPFRRDSPCVYRHCYRHPVADARLRRAKAPELSSLMVTTARRCSCIRALCCVWHRRSTFSVGFCSLGRL
jgi:branched-chain amino acid transport system permease protein